MQSLPTLSLLARWSTNWSDRLPAALLLLMALCASTAQAACVRDPDAKLANGAAWIGANGKVIAINN